MALHGRLDAGLLIVFVIVFISESPRGFGQGGDSHDNATAGSTFNVRSAIPLAASIIILAVVWFYIRYIIWRNLFLGSGNLIAAPDVFGSTTMARGLQKEVIEKLPTFKYATVKTLKIGKGTLECAVCLNEFQDDEILRLISHCSHVFHRECVDLWLSDHTTCPVCRTNLLDEPEKGENNPEPVTNATTPSVIDVEVAEINGRADDSSSNWPRRTNSALSSRLHPSFPPRSNSTGHIADRNSERFVLRLPENIRSIITSSSTNRNLSETSLPTALMSRREGYRSPRIDDEAGDWLTRHR